MIQPPGDDSGQLMGEYPTEEPAKPPHYTECTRPALCSLCGERGKVRYTGLRDLFFGTPGTWRIAECPNPACGLLWVDPFPTREELEQAYRQYYTHSPPRHADTQQQRKGSELKAALRSISGIDTATRRARLMYIDQVKPGKLLEIGCGNGDRLAAFRSRGWEVQGQETDLEAARFVRDKHAIEVLTGPIEKEDLAPAQFDAIIMNHVLEHISNPAEVLSACRQLLKPGGILSLITPNSNSMGHSVFQSGWRGLEPPRHVYIYNSRSIGLLLSRAGFRESSVFATAINAAGIITLDSLRQKIDPQGSGSALRGKLATLLSQAFRLTEILVMLLRPDRGEELVVQARLRQPGTD